MLAAIGVQWSDEKIENLFEMADADGSGTVDKKEFLSYYGLLSNDPRSPATANKEELPSNAPGPRANVVLVITTY